MKPTIIIDAGHGGYDMEHLTMAGKKRMIIYDWL